MAGDVIVKIQANM